MEGMLAPSEETQSRLKCISAGIFLSHLDLGSKIYIFHNTTLLFPLGAISSFQKYSNIHTNSKQVVKGAMRESL